MSYSLTQKDLVHARLSPAGATASTQGGHASSAIVPGRLEMHLISSSSSNSSSPDTSYALTQDTLTEASLRLSPAVATGSTHSGHASIAVGRLEMDMISSSSNSPHVPDSFTQRNLIDARQWLLPAVATAGTHGGHASSAVGPGRNEVHLISSSSNIGCSYYPDKSIASSPAAATASTQGGHASCNSIVPVPRGIPSWAPYPPMMCYSPHVVDYGDRSHILDMGMVLDYDWVRLPCGARVTEWVSLPGMPGSFVRLREARIDQGEHGLAMFPWGNYKGISRPGMPEYTMDFHNSTAPGEPYYFCLCPEDCLLWCPMKYVWPVCGCCSRFLYPPEDHRGTRRHQKRVAWMHCCTSTQADLERIRSEAAWSLSMKNHHGMSFGRCL